MGNLKPIDSALVKDVDYDLISPDTVGGEYIETIGAACQNPDGYTSGSLFLGRENGVQHLYRATAAIALGETIILDTNCVYTTVSGELEGKAEESEVTSLNEALTNLTEITTYQRALYMPSSGSLLDFIDDNCTGTGLYTITIGDATNITDLPASYGSYSTSYVLCRNDVKEIFLTTYNSYTIWMNIATRNSSWIGWKKLSTDIELPTQRVAITGASEYYTIEQNGSFIESYYYNRFGLCFVEVNVRCVTPRTVNTQIATLPTPNGFNTIHPVLIDYEAGEVMPVIFQGGYLYVKGGTAGKLYSGTFCYPIA